MTTEAAATEATMPEQQEFPVVPVPENEYSGAAEVVFIEAFREQFKEMFLAGVEQADAQDLAHMYALACAEEHLGKVAHIRGE